LRTEHISASNQDKQTTLPQARPANAKPSEVIVSLRVKLELLPLFQCIYTRLPYLKRRKSDWVRILHTHTHKNKTNLLTSKR
jgi:hypothetical protein